MSNWYTVATPPEVDRLRAAWPGAPVENVELCATLLDVAREQVEAFAPALDESSDASFTLAGGDGGEFSAVFTIRSGWVEAIAHLNVGTSSTSPAGALPIGYRPESNAIATNGPETFTVYPDGAAWFLGTEGGEVRLSYPVPSDAPAPGDIPSRYAYAQLQQAMNLWAAGRADENGNIGTEGYSFQPRPLDKTIRNIIRPTSGVPSVL